MEKRPLIVGNWKLNGTTNSNQKLLNSLKASLQGLEGADFVVCPPFTYLTQAHQALRNSHIAVGAQNVSDQESGAFTGEVSATMLTEIGCSYVIIGHMERRVLYGEDEELLARKFERVQNQGLIPIFCVGETVKQRDQGEQYDIIATQLDSLQDIYQNPNFAVAYEPGWAIGTGRSASTEEIFDMHKFIYKQLDSFLHDSVSQVRVIYGGSINADNAYDLFSTSNVDGGLVGGASLDSHSFGQICQLACDVICQSK